VEYLAFAKPTVVNQHPEHSMIVEKSGGALVVDWTPEAFADAIIWCLDHPVEAEAMARRGREWVREHRTYDRLGDFVYRRLQQVLAH
jgi:glycosyltransferase involved in cell wall biosynthesis